MLRPTPRLVFGALALLLVAEAVLRAAGYASPVLYVADPDYEYALAPNQDTHRFGVRIETNRWGMRSPDFESPPPGVVLVLGDSVVNGGNWTDQGALATSLLGQDGRPVLNVSAGSWGPGNILAYIDRHGLFGAEDIILVLSSYDYRDDRTFGPLHGYATPTAAPRVALLRAIDHYVLQGPAREDRRTRHAGVPQDASRSIAALLDHLSESPAGLCVVFHWTRPELEHGQDAEARSIADLVNSQGIRLVDTKNDYRDALARGERLFRDDVHLTNAGQAVLADVMRDCLSRDANAPTNRPGGNLP